MTTFEVSTHEPRAMPERMSPRSAPTLAHGWPNPSACGSTSTASSARQRRPSRHRRGPHRTGRGDGPTCCPSRRRGAAARAARHRLIAPAGPRPVGRSRLGRRATWRRVLGCDGWDSRRAGHREHPRRDSTDGTTLSEATPSLSGGHGRVGLGLGVEFELSAALAPDFVGFGQESVFTPLLELGAQ